MHGDPRSAGLWLGTRRDDEAPLLLPREALLRHMMALGSSGSGKTVLSKVVVEECLRHGVPAICVDPQGDICSLLESSKDPQALRDHGVDPAIAQELAERADVVVFTPGADVGVPLCADPVEPGIAELTADEQARSLTRVAATLTSLLGYELGSDDGDGLCAALDHACSERLTRGASLTNLADVAEELSRRGESDFEGLSRFLAPRKLQQAVQRLARLEVGARRRLFHDGFPIDVDMLLGRGPDALPGKTRISVIYVNALTQQEDKELVVAALADRLYRWMLDHPSQDLQALFYIDEVAPFIPPVRKPSCKTGLSMLFKQARKYGLGCLMATQNPGDVDYKAMAQFGTWALGRLTTRQDRKKVEPTVASLADDASDEVMAELPRLKAGQFVLLSPDHFDAPQPLACRWLLTAHETFDERRIRAVADARWRERFVLEGAARTTETPQPVPVEAAAKEVVVESKPKRTAEPPPKKGAPSPSQEGPSGTVVMAPFDDDPPPRAATPTPAPAEPVEASWLACLARASALDARGFAEQMGVSVGTARRRARQLIDRGEARSFERGRTTYYWALQNGLRPDLGLDGAVVAAGAVVQHAQAQTIAEQHRRTRVLGMLGAEERVTRLTLIYMPLIHIPFEERVERSFLERALGPSHDRIKGSVYLHPTDLRFLVLDRNKGIGFFAHPASYASKIDDLDGSVSWLHLAPATIRIDEAAWAARRDLGDALQQFRTLYDAATPGPPSYVFLPYWHLELEQDGGSNYRVLDVDAVTGHPIERGIVG